VSVGQALDAAMIRDVTQLAVRARAVSGGQALDARSGGRVTV
jgi:hypothetical protein